MQQQRQHQYYRRSLCRLCIANAAGPHTTVGTYFDWADVCGFLKPPGSDRYWKVRMDGAFSIPHSCHHETWLHLEFVDWRNRWSKQGDHDRHISLKGRPAACSYGNQKRRISEVMSDHALSS